MKNIKTQINLLLMMMLFSGITACKKNNGFNTIVSDDKTKPGVVSNIKVDNFNGGANITYDLPNSSNILYVLAQYKISDNISRETKSSYYQDTVVVNGFAQEKPYEVTLYTVTRANVKSDPVTVTVNPKTPVYALVRPTINLLPDFGGVNITADNPAKKEVGLVFLSYNANTHAMEIQDQFFSSAEKIDYSVTGYKSEEQNFEVYVTDRWGNVSDTLKKSLTPLYEEPCDKSKFTVLNYPSDSPIGFGWILPGLWDGKLDGNGWHTPLAGEPAPYTCSFGIGNSYKLSRFVLYERIGSEYTYRYANPKEFSLWGSNAAAPQDVRLPLVAAEGTVLGDWVNLGNFKFPDPPSGNKPGETTSADEDFVRKGVSFKVSFQAPPARFLRLSVKNTWGGLAGAHLMEFTPYGTPQ
jgi:hypothetical protein